ncbi:protein tyrosine phosphatase PRL [Trypanosoma cruzi]|nr:protein tyrosine phosphatase PRL [Trypanosoma cruzi]
MGTNGTLVECKRGESDAVVFRFLIFDAPSPSSVTAYVKLMQRYNVRHIVRACGQTYSAEAFEKQGMCALGTAGALTTVPHQRRPSLTNWLNLLEQEKNKSPPETIAVHCVAGLGEHPFWLRWHLWSTAECRHSMRWVTCEGDAKAPSIRWQLNWLMRYNRVIRRVMRGL